jgi:hypothetical protein
MTVAEFLHAATSVLQAVVGHGADPSGVGRWIATFQGFVTAFEHQGILNTATSSAHVEKACWKISQDILIRLRQLGKITPESSSKGGNPKVDLRSIFTEQDIECLRTQLFAIQMRWQSLQPESSL